MGKAVRTPAEPAAPKLSAHMACGAHDEDLVKMQLHSFWSSCPCPATALSVLDGNPENVDAEAIVTDFEVLRSLLLLYVLHCKCTV